ncbi:MULTISPECIES: leucyl/phenylalanyl-tRNA--protein transferase [Sphingobacterium]|uniref:Leucyl/phenylalanyl-tRNA--protein transferase n=1 Tax=Sphingobacterium litopenaei TaxID=2763500 RepID=A0ABR7YCP5_9SPHI|nr:MULTISPECIES: leucyl/phenylalanyl-tRNA--protein transferase [Sphingobacterium]MBD1429071.1 leucyl/phenylalanyl-tRNA--protein transferase [Sphingobacterium litopenaei]NGM72418.1 leucyl/phenylalanyl-tRNA--protein transferase [Sphingobacterium sp. SGL-16]
MIFRLDEQQIIFPDPSLAEEDGLLAVGGDLSLDRLRNAYANGIFPWYSEETLILWYAPHERFVLYPQEIKVSKSMSKIMDKGSFEITFDIAFEHVIHNCASADRKDQDGTWIVDEMQKAYINLHQKGFAHSIEVWQDGKLVGGLYGVLIGKVFCGESMFSKVSNASKAALIYLCKNFDLDLVDCQIHSDHLESMGAKLIDSKIFYNLLQNQQYNTHGLQNLLRYSD